jgi:hypothetical protein
MPFFSFSSKEEPRTPTETRRRHRNDDDDDGRDRRVQNVAAFFPREEGEEEEANAEDLDRITPLFSERNTDADADDAMRKPLIFVCTRRDRRREKSEALFGKKRI